MHPVSFETKDPRKEIEHSDIGTGYVKDQTLSSIAHFTEKQLEATKAADKARYLLYGGAAGGGKSYFLRWYCVRQLLKWHQRTGIKGIRVGLFCEDYPALRERHVSKIQYEFPEWLGALKDSTTDGLVFKLKPDFGDCVIALKNLDDPGKYLSSEFALIAVDELTRNEQEKFDLLRSRLRWTGINETKFIAATNPGGIGHNWVKKRWIDKEFDANEQEPQEFVYIPALPTDNPHLAESYITALKSLPDKLRQAYLEGSWDVFAGQFFSEWRADIHTVDPYPIPDSWKKIRCIDHGRTAPTACLWGAIDYDGKIHWYREYYMAGVDADINAQAIARLSTGETYSFTVLDSACFSKTGFGETIAEIYLRNGVVAEPSHKSRLAGAALTHEYLRGDGTPKMVFFKTCRESIRTIPSLIHDDRHPEDVDTGGEDHAYDAIQYGLQHLHESKSPKPLDPVESMLLKVKQKATIGPENFRNYYGRR